MRVLDCNNFWSPTGGGVRRYHLQKLEYFKAREDVQYIFLMQDKYTETEVLNDHTLIEHVKAFKVPGNWEYRILCDWRVIREMIIKHQPDVVEVGSPYVMPGLVLKAIDEIQEEIRLEKGTLPEGFVVPRVVGFWHADFPVTYVYRFFRKFGEGCGRFFEKLAWAFARRQYGWMDGIYVSSKVITERMNSKGLKHTFFVPLGVDADHFHPSQSSEKVRSQLLQVNSDQDRRSFFFPHRFSQEKGLRDLVEAYRQLSDAEASENDKLPRLVFAGTGPDLEMVESLVEDLKLCEYLGFIESKEEMAQWYASCELGLALSGWETFGLSILEAMAAGQVLIGANTGAASEHILNSGSDFLIPTDDVEALKGAILRLASLSDEDLAVMSQAARDYAEKLTWNHCFDLEVIYYKEVCDKNNGKKLNVTLQGSTQTIPIIDPEGGAPQASSRYLKGDKYDS